MRKKTGDSATLFRVIGLIKPYLWLLGLSLVFAVVTVVTTLYAPVLTGQAIDHVVAPGKVDFDAIKEKVPSILTPVVFTNLGENEKVIVEGHEIFIR